MDFLKIKIQRAATSFHTEFSRQSKQLNCGVQALIISSFFLFTNHSQIPIGAFFYKYFYFLNLYMFFVVCAKAFNWN